MSREATTQGATTMTFPLVKFTKNTYSSMSILGYTIRTKEVPARDRLHAQRLADMYGREGWLLKDIVDTEHAATVKFGGPTLSGNQKWNWVFECNCGDEDATGYKADAVKIAKEHTANVTVINKNRRVS
jgi:hypothetical protein